ncbi:MAG: 2-dehydropantoate 2-reductase [Anaerolineae bacterium]|nr:2-dehydropantoate 2-reductase [Anaerolineae bacterium]
MRIAIFGMGGVGGYFGGRLAQAGYATVFVARGEHLAAIRAQGLQVDSDRGAFVARPQQATATPAEVGVVDVVIVATKAWQVEEAAAAMRPMVGPQTAVVPLLNGVEAPAQLVASLGAAPVLGGFCRVMSWISGPGQVTQRGVEPYVSFGELDGTPSARVTNLAAAFQAAGVTVEVPSDIQAAMWQKLVFIASLSGLGAVTRAPAGVLREHPALRQMLEAAMQEVCAVAAGRGHALASDAVAQGMALVDALRWEATASMQRDLMRGRPSELEAQNGAVVRLGAEVGISTPIHHFFYTSLLPAELKARGQLHYNL